MTKEFHTRINSNTTFFAVYTMSVLLTHTDRLCKKS